MGPQQKSNGVQKEFSFPGVPALADGSEAVARTESQITQGGFTHPIIPSDRIWKCFLCESENKNFLNEKIAVRETESAVKAAGECEGFALAGGRATSFTSGDDLVSMKGVMYSIAGKRLPVVIHAGTRALTSHSSTFYSGHDDVMGVNDCGWGMLFAKNVQEASDFTLIARRTAEDSYTPFLNIQDGFYTTHTQEKIYLPETELLKQYVGNPADKLVNQFDPAAPIMTGVYQNPDSFMKGKIAQRDYYEKIPLILKSNMDEFYELTGRRYDFIEEYLLDDADFAIVGLGNVMLTVMKACVRMRENSGIKTGALNISVYRPFPIYDVIKALSNVKAFTVIERMDNPLASNNPLSMEIKSCFADALLEQEIERIPDIYTCSYGLGGSKTLQSDILKIANNMIMKGKRQYSIGVEHAHSIDEHFIPGIDGFKSENILTQEL